MDCLSQVRYLTNQKQTNKTLPRSSSKMRIKSKHSFVVVHPLHPIDTFTSPILLTQYKEAIVEEGQFSITHSIGVSPDRVKFKTIPFTWSYHIIN